MHDVIIVGTGPAGTAAALEFALSGIKPFIVDVGHTASGPRPNVDGNLYTVRSQRDTFDLVIGERFQGLANILTDRHTPVKLMAPALEYVTRDAERLSPIDESEFSAIQSFAAGGLANAWGAGLYRYTDRDLEGFPIVESDLSPYFDTLTQEIGISGTEDDLAPFLGRTRFLQPPMRLSHNVDKLYRRYERKRKRFTGEVYIGHPRIAALTQAKDGRPALSYDNLEFWKELPSIYRPRMTLEKLIHENKVTYRRGVLVECWSESLNSVRIDGTDLDRQEAVSFTARKLLLSAGAINTSKIVLEAMRDYRTQLTLLENPALQLPLVLPTSIGRCIDRQSFGLTQLILIWESENYDARLQGSIMELTAPMRAEFFGIIPYAAHANLAALRCLLPGMLLMQLFFPASHQEPNFLSLQDDGRLLIRGRRNTLELKKLKTLLRHLWRLGAWTHPALIVRVPTGHAVHYAGTLPMRRKPQSYECDPIGKLHGTRHVFIGDSASFPALPAKNMSFAMMANAMRIAHHVADELRGR